MLPGARQYFAGGGAQPPYWGLTLTSLQDGSTVALSPTSSAPARDFLYSMDGGATWGAYAPAFTISLDEGSSVCFAAAQDYSALAGSSSASSAWRFRMSGSIAASGSVMSLLSGDETRAAAAKMGAYAFVRLFQGCTSLVSAPELPATTLAEYCYYSMFQGCTSLVSAPELPATTLAGNCYRSMFQGCTSLVSAPELPATTLAEYCYYLMFYGCTGLTSATVNFTDFSQAPAATNNWMRNVADAGTFRCPAALGTNETISRGISYCPSGWTVVNI